MHENQTRRRKLGEEIHCDREEMVRYSLNLALAIDYVYHIIIHSNMLFKVLMLYSNQPLLNVYYLSLTITGKVSQDTFAF